MRIQSKYVLFAAGVTAAVGLFLFIVHSYRHRFVRDDRDLLALLPGGDVTTFFADVAALRSAGMLNLLAGAKPTGDADYKQFVAATGFDYTQDLALVAATVTSQQMFFVARGHFAWDRLERYAGGHGGSCRRNVCSLPGSKQGRWVSFLPIQPDVIGVAISADDAAAEQLRPEHRRAAMPMPSAQPVWIEMAPSLLKNPLSLPLGLRIFAVSVQSANEVLLSMGRAAEHSPAAFNLQLEARCPNTATAESTRNQLEIQTKMLKLELAREHAQASPADLTGLLTAGVFQVVGSRVVGTWPVRKELLNTLQ